MLGYYGILSLVERPPVHICPRMPAGPPPGAGGRRPPLVSLPQRTGGRFPFPQIHSGQLLVHSGSSMIRQFSLLYHKSARCTQRNSDFCDPRNRCEARRPGDLRRDTVPTRIFSINNGGQERRNPLLTVSSFLYCIPDASSI